MANLQRLLGTLLVTGAGRNRRGASMAAAVGGLAGARAMGVGRGSFSKKAGLAALGWLAYKAYQDYQAKSGATTAGATSSAGGGGVWSTVREGIAGALGGGIEHPVEEPRAAAAAGEVEDPKALLLIRAMIAAANGDGHISPDERQRIFAQLDEVGAGPEEHAILEREIARPRSVDEIVREVRDEETAEQVYLASRVAMHPDTSDEKAYLQYLAARLNLPPERVAELDAAV
jgi:uncharacterized membrane protein YebE (DUF533 family)